jgi:HK97 family phage portal protein
VLKHPGKLTDEGHTRLKNSVKQEYSGASNAFRTMILEEGMSWDSIGIPPEDAQFLETRKFQVSEIARWFRVPPHKLADLERATFSNIEHQGREYVTDTLMPWIVRLEQEADRKLFAMNNRASMYTKINANALMRGDSKARADFYQKLSNLGVLSINEIRELEDIDPIGPEGDKRFVQLNLTTIDKVGEETQAPAPLPMIETDEDEDGLSDSE